MAYSREQLDVARRALAVADRLGAGPKVRKALIEAGLVESGLQHDRYREVGSGDRDSVGFLQQRPSQGWGPAGESVEQDAAQFIRRAMRVSGKYGTAGALAQAVQRSAFPGKYQERGGDAEGLLASLGGDGSGRSSPSGSLPSQEQPASPLQSGGTGLAELLAQELGGPPKVQSSGVPAPVVQQQSYLAGNGLVPQSQGGPRPAQQDDMAAKLGALSQLLGGGTELSPSQPADAGSGPANGAEGTPRVRTSGNLVRSVQSFDSLAGRLGVPMTAKQEPGHQSGGDHDPAVRNATARDFGGSEAQRKRLFEQITRSLGVKDAVYKGADINVVRNGIRYQIISRDHGTGPHLHVGLRKAQG